MHRQGSFVILRLLAVMGSAAATPRLPSRDLQTVRS